MGQDAAVVTVSPAVILAARAIVAAAGPVGEAMHKVHEVATLLGVDKSTVYRHIAGDKLHAVRAGRSLRIPDSALQAYLRPASETPGPTTPETAGLGTRVTGTPSPAGGTRP